MSSIYGIQPLKLSEIYAKQNYVKGRTIFLGSISKDRKIDRTQLERIKRNN